MWCGLVVSFGLVFESILFKVFLGNNDFLKGICIIYPILIAYFMDMCLFS